jgi:hypothetical protein
MHGVPKRKFIPEVSALLLHDFGIGLTQRFIIINALFFSSFQNEPAIILLPALSHGTSAAKIQPNKLILIYYMSCQHQTHWTCFDREHKTDMEIWALGHSSLPRCPSK